MALRVAGVRLTVEGQAEYKAGLSEINREQRLLAEQSKLAVAQLGTQASRQATYSTSMSNYARQIEVASQKTNTLKNRQQELPRVQNEIKTAIDGTNSSYRDSQKETERLKNNYDEMRKALGSNHEETKKAKAEYQASRAETKELATEVKNLEKAYNANDKELKNLPFSLSKAELATQQLRNEAQKLHEEYRNAGGRYADLSNNLSELEGKLNNVGGVMKSVGGFATKYLTAPLLLAGGAAIKASIDFESAFAGTMKTVDELYDANGNLIISYQDLSDEIRRMAREDLPASTTEIAAVAEAAGQLGIATEEVMSFSKIMIDLGESTNLGSEEAATALARLANITQMPQTQFSNLGSSIVQLGNTFATTEAEITHMALRLAGIGAQIGMSEAEILGLAAAMSSVGIEAEAGGTAMTTSLKKMQNVVAMHAGVQERLDEAAENLSEKDFKKFRNEIAESEHILASFAQVAGLTSDEFADLFNDDPARALQRYVEGLEQASNNGENLNEILGMVEISGIREADAMLRLAGNSKLVGEALDSSSEAWEENMALTEEAEKRYATTESQLQMLRNQVSDVAIEFGGPLVAALREGMDAIEPWIRRLADVAKGFSDLDEEQQRTIIKWGLLAMAGGPVLSMFGNITTGVGTLSGGMSTLVQWFGKVTTPKTVGDVTGAFTTIGGGAAGAATQVGGLTTMIGGLPIVLGVAGAAMLGWTAWKVWGEDAWNSAQRTKEWGFDVGETVNNTLSDIKGFSESASGHMNLLSQGFAINTSQMSEDFANMGMVIESSLTERILSLDELIAGLPDTVRTSLEKLLQEDKKQAEESLAIVEENNARIAELRETASNHNRDLSIVEAEMIRKLNQESAEAYINTLKISQEERKQLLDAMNGDVEQATQEEARIWAENLARQRQEQNLHYGEQKREYLEALKELGYSDEALREHERIWEIANKSTIDGIDAQLAIIAEKYPEIAEQIFFANGQMIDASDEMGQSMIKQNMEIIESSRDLSSQLAQNAERNARQLEWMSDTGQQASDTWNGLVFDEKTGEVHTNVRKEIIEAGKDLATWNDMRFILHDANVNSNAKQMIGEAAIVNERWDSLPWSEKEIILKDEFSITMFKALEETGKWNELSVEQKTALLYSNTPEVMAQTLFELGLWEDFLPQIKHLNADNYGILSAINMSETAIEEYNKAPTELKTLLAEDPATLTFTEAKLALEAYENLSPEMKALFAVNVDAMAKIRAAEERINHYNENVNPGPKHLHATSNIPDVVTAAQRAIDRLTGKTVRVDTVHRNIYDTGPAAIRAEHGLNFHQGGPMIVNDQRGPLFKELVTYPDGTSFIPEGRNVLIPNAPRGAKVLKASLTKDLIPRYERGIGFDTASLNRQTTISAPPTDFNAVADMVAKAVTKSLSALSFEGMSMVLNDRVVGRITGEMSNTQGAIMTAHNERGLAGN